MFDAIRVIAARLGLAVHEISADQLDGRLFIEMHLEVDEHLSLKEAHRRATELEEEIRKLPGVAASSRNHYAETSVRPLPLHQPAVQNCQVKLPFTE